MFWKKNQRQSDSRVQGDRRVAAGSGPGTDEKRTQERRQGERRQLVHAIKYSTSRPLGEIEDWLASNSKGEWKIVLDDINISGSQAKKAVIVMFVDESDKQNFIASFSARRRAG